MNYSLFYQKLCLFTDFQDNIDRVAPEICLTEKYLPLFENECRDKGFSFNDIAKLIHNILVRKEEYGDAKLDKWGRFDHDKSFLVQNGLDQSPIIDELILDVAKQLKLKIGNVWPDGKKAVVCLTHDVDAFDGISYLWLRKGFWLTKALQNFFGFKFRNTQSYLNKVKLWHNIKKDPMFAFDRWMELEDRYGFRSTFFFMSLENTLSREGRRYSCRNPRVIRVIRKLDEAGWEIGLHAARYCNMDLNYLRTQKDRLEQILGKEILGCRHHWLRVRFPASWDLYEAAGLKYSSNLGWDLGNNGFRAGTCVPYFPLSIAQKNAHPKLLEIPFHVMDSNHIEDPDVSVDLFLDYLEKVKNVGGCLVIDFHQEYFDENEAPGVNIVYKRILKILSEDGDILVTKLEDVYRHILAKFTGKTCAE